MGTSAQQAIETFAKTNHPAQMHGRLFEFATDAVVTTDATGRILAANSETERQFGYTQQELVGEFVEKLIPQCFREAHQHHRRTDEQTTENSAIQQGIKLVGLRKNGREFPVDFCLNRVVTELETRFYCAIRTTGEREAAIEERRQKLKLEQVLSELTARFISVPAQCLDQEITSGLRALAETLCNDHAHLGQIDSVTGEIVITHAWAQPGFVLSEFPIPEGCFPWLAARIRNGETCVAEQSADLPPEAGPERMYMEAVGQKSALVVPYQVGGAVNGGLGIGSFRQYQKWDDWLIRRVKDIACVFANAMARKEADQELRRATAQIQELKGKLERENAYLSEELKLEYPHGAIVGNTNAIREVLKRIEQVAKTDATVLILGETGTGKELVARTIHELSRRKQNSMVKINCAALPATLIESELFGREKGAYTGALAREIGRFEHANQSTIFLDEIAELPQELQPKLLRVLQEGEFERLGSAKTIRVDVRVVAATNRDLDTLMRLGKFREDLFYRLNVFPIIVPPLRERREDIPLIAAHILQDLAKRMGYSIEGFHTATMREFQKYSWPGNIRELRNVIERNLILNNGPIFRADVPNIPKAKAPELRRLDEVDTEYLRKVLQSTHWRVRGSGGAAEVLGLKPTTLEARMKKLGIRRREAPPMDLTAEIA